MPIFNNTDLHNIYNAINNCNGSMDPILDDLFNGETTPTNPGGFYPAAASTTANNCVDINKNTADTRNLLDGAIDPSNTGGFYPKNIQQTADNVLASFYLADGQTNPSNPYGFYPQRFDQIKTGVETIQTDVFKGLVFGSGCPAGYTLNAKSGTNFASPAAAAADAINALNTTIGINAIISLSFTDRGGANGHSWVCIYRSY